MIEMFNSPFEVSLRILIVLNVARANLSIDRLTAIDFISIYGKDFEVSDENLHGNNDYRFSEFASKREVASIALKELVLKGYVKPKCNKSGFTYCLTRRGVDYCQRFSNEYADYFSTIANSAVFKYSDLSDRKLIHLINEYAISMFGGKME